MPVYSGGSQPDLFGSIVPSGYYLRPPGLLTSDAGTASTSTGYERWTPRVITKPITIDRIGAEVTGAGTAGSVVRLGIRNSLANGLPGTLLLDAGTIDGTSATAQLITISQLLLPGLYWDVVRVEVAACTLRVSNAAGRNLVLPAFTGTTTPETDNVAGYRDAGGGSGALSAGAPTVAAILGSAPIVVYRIA